MNNSIQALISLLDDPDHSIFEHVRSEIEKMGNDAIPALEEAWENHSYGDLFSSRIEDLIQSIQNNSTINTLSNWVQSGEQDLLKGLIAVAKYQYPGLQEEPILELFNKIEKDVWIELNDELTSLEKLKVINHILFDVHGFLGNKTDYNNPDNSYINRVLETKKGNPISLSCIYMVLAKRLELPIYGINLPRHFILAWVDPYSVMQGKEIDETDILFYFNPFSEGAVFGRNDISSFLEELRIEPNKSFFTPCSTLDIMKRTLNNLGYAYQSKGMAYKARDIFGLKKSLE